MNTWLQVPGIVFSPRQTLARLASRWNWFPAWIVIAALQGGIALIFFDRRVFEFPISFVAVSMTAAALNPGVTLLAQVGLLSAIIWLSSHFFSCEEVPFGKWFSVLIWSFLPLGTIGFAMRLLTRLVTHAQFVFFGPAVLMPPTSTGLLKALLASLDVFSLVTVALAFQGALAVTKRKAPAVVVATVVYIFFLWNSFSFWH